jgi:hypothetical protein
MGPKAPVPISVLVPSRPSSPVLPPGTELHPLLAPDHVDLEGLGGAGGGGWDQHDGRGGPGLGGRGHGEMITGGGGGVERPVTPPHWLHMGDPEWLSLGEGGCRRHCQAKCRWNRMIGVAGRVDLRGVGLTEPTASKELD